MEKQPKQLEGTIYIRYERGLAESPVMVGDSHADIPREEFERMAWAVAIEKAKELGWKV